MRIHFFSAEGGFEWDRDKCQSNLSKHGIDFRDAARIFNKPVGVIPSTRNQEVRHIAFGEMSGITIAVVFTMKGDDAGLFRRGVQEEMSENNTESYSRAALAKAGRGRTDYEKLRKLDDQTIEKAVAKDADAAPIDLDWADAQLWVPVRKKAISLRLDDDVLAFFRSGGKGYQTRINAVLRQYMTHRLGRKENA